MKVGDLVRVKDCGVVDLITRIETVPNFYKSITTPTVWAYLSLEQSTPIKANKLEVLNEGR